MKFSINNKNRNMFKKEIDDITDEEGLKQANESRDGLHQH